MKSVDFIKEQLDELINTLPYIKCSYKYDEFDNTHIIKIEPYVFFEKDNQYIELERQIIDDFINRYPYEGIVFISENDIIDMSQTIFEVAGTLYIPPYSYNRLSSVNATEFYTCNFNIKVLENKPSKIDSNTSLQYIPFEDINPINFTAITNSGFDNNIPEYKEFSNESNYALAA